MPNLRQSRPDSGLGVQVKVFDTLQVVPASLGSGMPGGEVGRDHLETLFTCKLDEENS